MTRDVIDRGASERFMKGKKIPKRRDSWTNKILRGLAIIKNF